MLYICEKCGKFRADKIIDSEHNLVICPECGHSKSFVPMPLFAIGGASGTGKTALCREIVGKVDGVIALDGDVLWEDKRFSHQNPGEFYEYALRVAMNISQSSVPVAIFHAGFGVPDNLEKCIARRYFSKIHYLGLYCSDEELEKRLMKRPSVQGECGKGFINAMKGFNSFFRFYSKEPTINKIDTTDTKIEETARQVIEWIKNSK